MDDSIVWITPLLLMPGVALLVISTSARYGQLHDEIHRVLEDDEHTGCECLGHLRLRAVRFCNALFCLYLAITLLLLASFIGSFLKIWDIMPGRLIVGLCTFAVAAVTCDAFELVRESRISLRIINIHMGR